MLAHRPPAIRPLLLVASAIVLSLCALSPAAMPGGSGTVSGVVVDDATNMPIEGALVTLQATAQRTTTAADGSFQLEVQFEPSEFVVVAAKKGYYNEPELLQQPTGGVTFRLEPVDQGNDPAYTSPDPALCSMCHYEQVAQWTDTPMARAGSNTWVYDVYNGTGTAGGSGGFVYTRDSEHRTTNAASECASCHQPEPWVAQPYQPLDPIGALSAGAMHGVSCDICHKIAHVDESQPNAPGLWPGAVTVTRPKSPLSAHQVQYGVLGDASFEQTALMRPSYQPQLTAAVCAACHQDKNDPDGEGPLGFEDGVVSEPTYIEWLESPYGDPASEQFASCVDCHMPAYGQTKACESGFYDAPERDPDTIRSHTILGTTPEFLENAVELTLTGEVQGGVLRIDASILNNQTGHHVPTGVTVRNMILVVDAWRVSDGAPLQHVGPQVVHELGGVGDPAQGYYAGLPGKLYAKVNHDKHGAGPTFFTDATGIQFDSRIPALGRDETAYEFLLPAGGGAVEARARLIYRRAFRFFVDAKSWTQDGHGAPLADVQAPDFGHLMEAATWSGAATQAVTTFGDSCGGLGVASVGWPQVGSPSFGVVLTGGPAGQPASLLLGTSGTHWEGLVLPLPLDELGLTGCALRVSPDWALSTVRVRPNGTAHQALPLPADPAFTGLTLFGQWTVLDDAAPGGLRLSGAVAFWIQP
jgi:hypothetical protein